MIKDAKYLLFDLSLRSITGISKTKFYEVYELDIQKWIRDTGYWILDTGNRLLGIGYWKVVIGNWKLVLKYLFIYLFAFGNMESCS